MKNLILSRFFLSGFVFAAAVLLASAVSADGQAIQPAKVAVVNSNAFYDAKGGLTRFIAIQKTLEADFKPRQDELMRIRAQMEALEKEIKTTRNSAAPAVITQKADQYESLKREYTNKGEDANLKLSRRTNELTKPVSDDVGKAMNDFAKKNGIDILIDAGKMEGLYIFNNAVDLTPAFVTYFNALPVKP